MSKKLYTILMAAAVFAGVLGFTLGGAPMASAAMALAAGTGPQDAMAPTGQWTALGAGQQTWYAFRYEGDSSQIQVRMSVDPADSAAFEVWTPDQLQQWAQGDTVNPVGRGSADNALGGDLVWAGSFNTPGTYYVIVSQTGSTPANYALRISGSAVSFSQPAAQPAAPASAAAAAAASVQAAAETAKPAVATKSGTGPGDALAASGQWLPLAVGQQVWYAFSYSGDGSEVTVDMTVVPGDGATFAVWTPNEVAQSAVDDTIQPVGRGIGGQRSGRRPGLGGQLQHSRHLLRSRQPVRLDAGQLPAHDQVSTYPDRL